MMLSDQTVSPRTKVQALFRSILHWNKFVKKRENVKTPAISTYVQQVRKA